MENRENKYVFIRQYIGIEYKYQYGDCYIVYRKIPYTNYRFERIGEMNRLYSNLITFDSYTYTELGIAISLNEFYGE